MDYSTLLLVFLIPYCFCSTLSNSTEPELWKEVGKMTGLLVKNCMKHFDSRKFDGNLLENCLKQRTLFLLDGVLDEDVIGISNNVELVRYRQENHTEGTNFRYGRENHVGNWESAIFQRIAHVFDTHLLKIHFTGEKEARGRRKKQGMMLSLMAFGIAAMGLIMVPMGFQFLAVLGGKALLLAKMALLLTAIQGLKKIAKSNINYGLYATPEHSAPWQYERRWPTHNEEGQILDSPQYYDNLETTNNKDLLHPPQKYYQQPHPRLDVMKKTFLL